MSQVMVTIVAPLDPARLGEAQSAIDRLGNPPSPEIRARLDELDSEGRGVHFISLHALPSYSPGKAHLVLEFSADGDERRAIGQIAAAIGVELSSVFMLAKNWGNSSQIGAYLASHTIKTGFGLGANPGIGHAGNPGMTVGQIRAEQRLAEAVGKIIESQPGRIGALERLQHVRRDLPPEFADYLKPTKPAAPFTKASLPSVIAAGLGSFARTYLWPFLLLVAVWTVALAVCFAWGEGDWLRPALAGAWCGIKTGLAALLVGLIAGAAILYLRLRRLEETDWISSRSPDPTTLHEIIARENFYAHNHMVSLTELKGGWLRRFTIRLVFWAIALLGPRLYRPGYLSDIGTIHFARWVTLPGTRDFVFFSNYGGSWEAYLEDFITLANAGLTGVWSNTVGFPKSTNLIQDGASDGERFKRFARQSMLPTRFWYSAYPELITDMIRANAEIRRGLSGAMTEDDAVTWLSHFGSTLRPVDRLVTSEIQSLLFGGLGFLQYGALTLWDLPPDRDAARAWLNEISASIAWGDGRRLMDDDATDAVVQLALSAPGLAALGLSKWGLSTFPAAFLDGMTGKNRERILGDVGANAVENWWWGKKPSDVAILAYAATAAAHKQLLARIAKIGKAHGAVQVHQIDMEKFDRKNAVDRQEPFGFADGVSQPVIKGTYKGLKNSDPLHLVEPGEFILGYPDNRGNLPPVPMLPAIADPDNVLPVLGESSDYSRNSVNHLRDLGCNGSFLVIRQLEQDREAFDGYCADEAKRLKGRLAPPYKVDAEFIGAKMVGRWKDGTALVRAPYNQPSTPMNLPANDFMLGAEDSEGMRCPFGAHIRRANPRDSLNPGSMEQVGISNRHRLLRVGRKYAPERGQKPGLLFMSLVGDIERQFEFVQQTWLLGNVISLACPTTLSRERDPVMSSGAPEDGGFTIPTRDGPVKLKPMSRFVTTRGGGYFFLPGKRLVAYLAKPR